MQPRTNRAVVVLCALAGLVAQGCAAESGDAGDPGDVNPSNVEAIMVSMPACGTTLASFDGSAAYSNAGNTGTGVSCAGERGRYGYQYQCVELVMRHFTTHYGISWRGNAKDLLRNAPRASVDVRNNGDREHPPVPGDMLVWTNGTWGHVALVTAVRSNAVDIIEQNVRGNGRATLGYDGASIAGRWGSWVPAGWAHARANTTTPAPTPDPTPDPMPDGCAGFRSPVWTCRDDGSARIRCRDGRIETETCAHGCTGQPVGVDDFCTAAPVADSCAGSASGRSSVWTCTASRASRQRCVDGRIETDACARGCASRPIGVDDVCVEDRGSCGSFTWSIWTCRDDGAARVRCIDGHLEYEPCYRGCTGQPAGVNDYCS